MQKPSTHNAQFISESQKQKEGQELKVLFQSFKENLEENLQDFEELKFVELLSKITQAFDNSIVLKDSKFEGIIAKVALNINMFKELKHACFFICFCAINNLNYNDIWDYFTSYLLNNKDKMTLALKCMVLMNYAPVNEKREFFAK